MINGIISTMLMILCRAACSLQRWHTDFGNTRRPTDIEIFRRCTFADADLCHRFLNEKAVKAHQHKYYTLIRPKFLILMHAFLWRFLYLLIFYFAKNAWVRCGAWLRFRNLTRLLQADWGWHCAARAGIYGCRRVQAYHVSIYSRCASKCVAYCA